jgi:TfoX/Sxy family transcriptional regulator of competence genes
MAYSEKLAERVRRVVKRHRGVTGKKMFGGLSFLIRGRMCCGGLGDKLVVRVSPEEQEINVNDKNTAPMDFTGRALKDFVYVLAPGTKSDASLKKWVGRAIAFIREKAKKHTARIE